MQSCRYYFIDRNTPEGDRCKDRTRDRSPVNLNEREKAAVEAFRMGDILAPLVRAIGTFLSSSTVKQHLSLFPM
jgi:hypothetical protein